jgi:hypothetical protein
MKPKEHAQNPKLASPDNIGETRNSNTQPRFHRLHTVLQREVDFVLFILLIISALSISIIVYSTQNVRQMLRSNPEEITTLSGTSSASNMIRKENIRKLESYFAKNESPLYPYARLIVEQAQLYGVDYRLVPAIAMNESTLCKNIHEDSYNCWGWGIYGDIVTRFESYEDAIRTITRGIREQYYDRGMSSPSAIMRAYTPSSPDGVWAKKIEWTYRQIDKQ